MEQQRAEASQAGRIKDAVPLAKQALALARQAFGDKDSRTLTSVANLGTLLLGQRRYAEAEPLAREVLQWARETFGLHHPTTLDSLNALGSLLWLQGRYAEADPLFHEALQGQREVLGPRHRETLNTLNSLAGLLDSQGRYAEAEPLAREALQGRTEVLGSRHPDTLTSLDKLAGVLRGQGRYGEAEPLLREALQARRETLGPHHLDTLTSLDKLAGVLRGQGRYGKAEPLYREVLQARRETLGPRHLDTLLSLNNLALLLREQGRYAEAEPLLREAVQGYREALGPRHFLTLRILCNFATVLDNQGRYAEAEPLLREVLQGQRETLGPRYPDTLNSMNNLAGLLDSQGRYAEAEPLLREALQGRRETLGPRHPDTLNSMNNLAGLLRDQGRYGEAEPLLREAVQGRNEVLGPRHPDTLNSMNTLAMLLQAQGRYAEAEPLAREALQANREALGPRHPETLRGLTNLALLLEVQGRYAEADPLAREALQANREALGPRHSYTLQSLSNLGLLLLNQGRYGEAEPLLREALQARRETLGPRHPNTLSSMNDLAVLLWDKGRHAEAEPLLREALQAAGDPAVLRPEHPETLLFQLNLIGLLAAQGRVAEAARLQQAMEPQVLTWLGSELYSTETASVRRHWVASQATYQDVALSLALLPGAGPDTAALAASALLRFKALGMEEEAYLAHLSRREEDPRVRAVAAEISQLHAELARAFYGEAKAEVVARLTSRLDAEELELGRISRGASPYLQVRDASVQKLRAALPPRSALLDIREYSPFDFKTGKAGPSRWAGVLTTAEGKIQVADLGEVSTTDRQVRAMLDRAGSPLEPPIAQALYRQLLAPFAAETAKLERLYVAPDGVLHLLAFPLLQDGQGRRVLEALDLRLVQTGRDLLRTSDPAKAPNAPFPKGLVAVGGIDFDLAAPPQPVKPASDDARLNQLRSATAETFQNGFETLPLSQQEVEMISALYRSGRRDESVIIAEGRQPTRSWLLSLPPPRVLHLATHGFYRKPKAPTDRPMLLAGVALAGANQSLKQGDQEGILYALEAQDLNLEGTELVVLSACDTALGQIDYSEGVAGLVRALRVAGARNVLVTLTPVNDQGAARFVQRFYTLWLEQSRSDPAAAFRQAQREQAVSGSLDPTWTSFILIGGAERSADAQASVQPAKNQPTAAYSVAR